MNSNQEMIINGRAVSRGIAVGRIVCLFGAKRQFVRKSISESQVEAEIERFRLAVKSSTESIEYEISAADHDRNTAASEILQSHRTILRDPSLQAQIIDQIKGERVNAEWAVFSAFGNASVRFISQPDERLKEKHLDVEDVCERILLSLGVEDTPIDLQPNSIVAAKEVSPAMFLNLAAKGMIGIIAESGGWTSHTSILAREAKIPAITGVHRVLESFVNDVWVGVDGFSGEAIINPSDETVKRLEDPKHSYSAPTEINLESNQSLTTLDGRPIILRTNTGNISSYQDAHRSGAKGIGLFRSETLIDVFGRIPNEDEQAKYYTELAKATAEYGIRIRTFDIDESVLDPKFSVRQKNPALGLRAIRLGLVREDLLRTQISALLRASVDTNIGVVIPMVSGTSEITQVQQMVSEESKRLEKEGVSFGRFDLGAMIEIPSAVLVADQLANICDFLCLGTNDLAQYLFAADRDNQSVSKWFRTLHPAMIRAVKRVIDECHKVNKPLVVCGEMAGSPFYVPVLIGLGVTELSMSPSSIGPVSRVIGGIAYDETVDLVRNARQLVSADEIEDLVHSISLREWSHLFSPGFLEMQSA